MPHGNRPMAALGAEQMERPKRGMIRTMLYSDIAREALTRCALFNQ